MWPRDEFQKPLARPLMIHCEQGGRLRAGLPTTELQTSGTNIPWDWGVRSTLRQPVAPVSLSTQTFTAGFAQSHDQHNVPILYFESVDQRTYSYLKTAAQNEHLLHTRYNFNGINTLLTGLQTVLSLFILWGSLWHNSHNKQLPARKATPQTNTWLPWTLPHITQEAAQSLLSALWHIHSCSSLQTLG